MKSRNLIEGKWKVNTAGLLKEILVNKVVREPLGVPIQIFASILLQVSERASELNDPLLNELMCRLSLYAISDPYNTEYDKDAESRIIEAAKKFKNK